MPDLFEEFKHKQDIAYQLNRIADILEKLYNLAVKEEQELRKPESIHIKWSGQIMASPSVSLNLDATASVTGTPVELNNDGSVFNFVPANISWALQNAGIVSMTVDPTTGIATFKPLAVGSTGVAVTDSTTGLVGQGTITVVAVGPTPASLSIQFSTPTP
jgi:hypothetical protein